MVALLARCGHGDASVGVKAPGALTSIYAYANVLPLFSLEMCLLVAFSLK